MSATLSEVEIEMSRLRDRNYELDQENCRLRGLIDTPMTQDFLKAVDLEAAHQVLRWGEDDRAKKSDADWLWLVVYLASKVIFGKTRAFARLLADNTRARALDLERGCTEKGLVLARPSEGEEKYQHRIITIAAAALNWHRNRWPGRGPENER